MKMSQTWNEVPLGPKRMRGLFLESILETSQGSNVWTLKLIEYERLFLKYQDQNLKVFLWFYKIDNNVFHEIFQHRNEDSTYQGTAGPG